MKKLGILLLLPALIMGTWVGPTMTSADIGSDSPQVVSVAGASSNLAQVEATPIDSGPESSDPASSDSTKDTGTNMAAPADFPNVCDGSTPPQYEVSFSVKFPEGDTTSSLQVRVFAENGGCIPHWGYAGPVMNFPDKTTVYGSQTVYLPAGRYIYEYSGDGFESKSYVPFEVVDGRPEEDITVTPTPLPASHEVAVNVTLPAGGSSMTVVVSDANGTIEGWTVPASDGSVTDTHMLKLPEGQYFYEYWGDDYPWSDRIPFTVDSASSNTISITPVIAAITLTPSQAPAGTSVEVRVTGFRADDEYELNFNNGQIVQYDRADINGEISTTITIPNGLAPGKYPVVVTGAVSGQRVEATFTVADAARLAVEPASGPAGTIVRVTGSGYTPDERVDILFGGENGELRGYVTATSTGTISGRITIPSSASMGDHTIVARGTTSGQSATATFTVTEPPVNVTVSPTSVAPGTIVTVTGSGFGSGEIVDIRWGSATGPLLGYRTADSSGSFTGRVTVPTTASAGDHALFAKGRTSSATGSATVSVTGPQVTVSPTTQTSGKVVSVAGSGFQPGEIVDIRWNGPSGKLLGYVIANSSGSVSGKVTVPAGTVPGDYSIVMIGRTSKLSGSATLTVTGATVTVTPSQASPGTVVSVAGSGFGPNEVVDIRWNGASGTLLGYRTTSDSGSMSGRVTIPPTARPGTYTLFLQGRSSGIVGTATVVIPVASTSGHLDVLWRGDLDSDGAVIAYRMNQTDQAGL